MATKVLHSGVRPPVSPRARVLLGRADAFLSRSVGAADATERFLDCYMAALRGAAAVLEATPISQSRARSRSAWVLLSKAAPDLDEWAEYFAGFSATRAALQAGLSRSISEGDADEFYREVGHFLHVVEDRIGADSRLDRSDSARRSMTA
ncbi:SAV_6107 family HEPN domain-containing protein [Rhodococcoides yunnanense]|uniref:SAV_6107 family HEPN domain-containing protein n=1 Tax=Rhodococcoides yunnanense TaxID=278209 RepID=UPI000933CD7F|nr:SAV_6107 family HEPN domain-containing protein [Rhodococcus yunnanensis]